MRVNEYAILVEPNLHDGAIDSLTVDREQKYARIRCRSVTNQRVEIHFKRVRALQGNDFREGNIIGTIWIYKGRQIPRDDVERLIFGDNPNRELANKLVSEIQSADTFLVKLWSSYGLQLMVLCGELSCELCPPEGA